MLEDGDVEQVLEAGLVEAVQIGVFEDAVRVVAADIEVALEDDAVLRQRAGLVRAQHVHRPEVLDRIEALDDDLLCATSPCAPLARLTVTIIGSISGVSPTATATANSSASSQLPLVRPLITNTRGAMTTMKPSIIQVNRVMPLSKLVSTRCSAIVARHLAEGGARRR